MTEPTITINGFDLSEAQAMTVRGAIEAFAAILMEEGLGDDEISRELTRAYLARIAEVRKFLRVQP